MTDEGEKWNPVEPRTECLVCGSHVMWLRGRKHCATCNRDRIDIELRPAPSSRYDKEKKTAACCG